jgi:hypothetical protein
VRTIQTTGGIPEFANVLSITESRLLRKSLSVDRSVYSVNWSVSRSVVTSLGQSLECQTRLLSKPKIKIVGPIARI